jgi:sugar phosphate isomerase/epimerase
MNPLGANLSFAVKRWVEPESWARVVREELELTLVQFSFDIIDPWWPTELQIPLAKRIRRACEAHGLRLHSAFTGLASYTYNSLLHPEKEGREAGKLWFRRAVDLASELEVYAVGGPAGAVSAEEATDAAKMKTRYEELLETLAELAEYGKAKGLKALLVEPTPLTREFPWNPDQAIEFSARLEGKTAVPIQYCLDWGHALYEPLYGNQAKTWPWLESVGKHISLLHLQQTDGQLDCHWGFTHKNGIVNPHEVVREIKEVGLDGIPVFLEVFYPFEWTDEQALADIKETCRVCRPAFGTTHQTAAGAT